MSSHEVSAGSARTSSQWGRSIPPRSAPAAVEVLIPSFERDAELAVTLSGLAAQVDTDFDVIISDQSEEAIWDCPTVAAMIRVLQVQGHEVQCLRNLPRRGMAHQRHILLEESSAERVLFLDSDVWLEPGTLTRLLTALDQRGGGFVGSAVQGLSYLRDKRPEEWTTFEKWDGPIQPEPAPLEGPAHERWKLHNAANLCHIAALQDTRGSPSANGPLVYKIAWVGGCVLFNREHLIRSGGFDFWAELPVEHAGEDVLAQWRVMELYGGAGVLPSGAVHLEAPTTVRDRSTDATELFTHRLRSRT